MSYRGFFMLGFLAICAAVGVMLPRIFGFAGYLFQGGERVYVVLPIMGAVLLGVFVLFLLLRNRYFDLFIYLVISFPLISVLNRRLELTVRGAQFFLETFILIGFAVLVHFVYQQSSRRIGVLFYLLVLLLAGSIVSALLNQSMDFRVLWFVIQENLLPFLMFLIAIRLIRNPDDVETTIRALLLTVLLFSVLSIAWVFVLGQTVGVDTGEVLTAQTRINSGFRRMLVGAGFVSANVGNRLFLICLPLAIASLRGSLVSTRNLVNLMAIMFSLYFVIASEHRAALMGAVLIFLVFIFFGRTKHVRLWIKLLVLGGVLFLFRETILEYLGRRILLDRSFLLDNSALKRLVMWEFAMQLFRDNPWFGIGPLNYLQASMHTRAQAITAHNYYVNMLAELGLFGFFAYMGMTITIFVKGLLSYRQLVDPYLKRIAFGILLGLLSYQFALFFAGGRLTHNNVIYIHSMYWLAVGILWSLPQADGNGAEVSNREERRSR